MKEIPALPADQLREIAHCRPELAAAIVRVLNTPEDPEPERSRETSRSGEPTLCVESRYLHSSREPVREAERLARQTLATSPDAVVVMGTGLGYHIQALRERESGIPILVVEPSPSLLWDALRERPARWWCRYGPDLLFLPRECDELAGELSSRGVQRPALLLLQGLAQLYRKEEETIRSTLEEYRRRRMINTNTLRRFGKLWVRNTIRNLPQSASLEDIASLPRIPDNIPALVCGAGPTLDAVIPYLPELRQRCVLIAVDTAVSVLQRARVNPHLVLVADPQYWNTRHLDTVHHDEPAEDPAPILVAESATHPRVFRLWPGRALLFASLFPLGAFLDRRMGREQKLGAGGSVATSAWDLARVLGAKSIYLAGMDLGFPDNRTHCSGSFFEERIILRGHRLRPAEGELFRYLHDARPQPVAAAGGGSVLSDRRMRVYRSWFAEQCRRHPDVQTCFLSPASSAVEGIGVVDPRDLIATAAPAEPVWAASVSSFTPSTARCAPREALSSALGESIAHISRIARDGITLCAELDAKRSLLPPDLLALEHVDQVLKSQEDRELAGFLAREALEGITAMRVETPREAVEQARRLYRALEDSCTYHMELLRRYR